jgi:hypothetical protein
MGASALLIHHRMVAKMSIRILLPARLDSSSLTLSVTRHRILREKKKKREKEKMPKTIPSIPHKNIKPSFVFTRNGEEENHGEKLTRR